MLDIENKRVYNIKYKKDNRKQINTNASIKIKKRVKLIQRYKRLKGCAYCGYTKNPLALQFDHIKGEKLHNISYMVCRQYSLNNIKKEIRKCQILCANCHQIKTHTKED